MQHFNKIQELRECLIRQEELLGELRAFLKQHLEANRKYKNGEKVQVVSEMDKVIGKGIVVSASLGVSLESYDISKYVKDPAKWEKDLSDIIYRVNKLRKDGTVSAFRLAICTATKTKGMFYSYIKPVE